MVLHNGKESYKIVEKVSYTIYKINLPKNHNYFFVSFFVKSISRKFRENDFTKNIYFLHTVQVAPIYTTTCAKAKRAANGGKFLHFFK